MGYSNFLHSKKENREGREGERKTKKRGKERRRINISRLGCALCCTKTAQQNMSTEWLLHTPHCSVCFTSFSFSFPSPFSRTLSKMSFYSGCGVRAEYGAWTGAYQYQNTSWVRLPLIKSLYFCFDFIFYILYFIFYILYFIFYL